MSAPRFPAVPPHKGHYESYYLRAADPPSGRSAWIRHTVFKRPGGPPTGAALVHAVRGRRRAARGQAVAPRPAPRGLAGDRRQPLRPGAAPAAAPRRSGKRAAWDLTFGPSSQPLRHLPARLYDKPLPRTKTESPLPDTTISGRVEDWELDGWPGVIGHNWGAEHAERWIWLHGTGFEGAPDAWLDVALGRVKVGPLTTPWIANGALHLDGQRHARRWARPAGPGERERGRRARSRSAGSRSTVERAAARLVDLLRPRPAASTAARTARSRASS